MSTTTITTTTTSATTATSPEKLITTAVIIHEALVRSLQEGRKKSTPSKKSHVTKCGFCILNKNCWQIRFRPFGITSSVGVLGGGGVDGASPSKWLGRIEGAEDAPTELVHLILKRAELANILKVARTRVESVGRKTLTKLTVKLRDHEEIDLAPQWMEIMKVKKGNNKLSKRETLNLLDYCIAELQSNRLPGMTDGDDDDFRGYKFTLAGKANTRDYAHAEAVHAFINACLAVSDMVDNSSLKDKKPAAAAVASTPAERQQVAGASTGETPRTESSSPLRVRFGDDDDDDTTRTSPRRSARRRAEAASPESVRAEDSVVADSPESLVSDVARASSPESAASPDSSSAARKSLRRRRRRRVTTPTSPLKGKRITYNESILDSPTTAPPASSDDGGDVDATSFDDDERQGLHDSDVHKRDETDGEQESELDERKVAAKPSVKAGEQDPEEVTRVAAEDTPDVHEEEEEEESDQEWELDQNSDPEKATTVAAEDTPNVHEEDDESEREWEEEETLSVAAKKPHQDIQEEEQSVQESVQDSEPEETLSVVAEETHHDIQKEESVQESEQEPEPEEALQVGAKKPHREIQEERSVQESEQDSEPEEILQVAAKIPHRDIQEEEKLVQESEQDSEPDETLPVAAEETHHDIQEDAQSVQESERDSEPETLPVVDEETHHDIQEEEEEQQQQQQSVEEISAPAGSEPAEAVAVEQETSLNDDEEGHLVENADSLSVETHVDEQKSVEEISAAASEPGEAVAVEAETSVSDDGGHLVEKSDFSPVCTYVDEQKSVEEISAPDSEPEEAVAVEAETSVSDDGGHLVEKSDFSPVCTYVDEQKSAEEISAPDSEPEEAVAVEAETSVSDDEERHLVERADSSPVDTHVDEQKSAEETIAPPGSGSEEAVAVEEETSVSDDEEGHLVEKAVSPPVDTHVDEQKSLGEISAPGSAPDEAGPVEEEALVSDDEKRHPVEKADSSPTDTHAVEQMLVEEISAPGSEPEEAVAVEGETSVSDDEEGHLVEKADSSPVDTHVDEQKLVEEIRAADSEPEEAVAVEKETFMSDDEKGRPVEKADAPPIDTHVDDQTTDDAESVVEETTGDQDFESNKRVLVSEPRTSDRVEEVDNLGSAAQDSAPAEEALTVHMDATVAGQDQKFMQDEIKAEPEQDTEAPEGTSEELDRSLEKGQTAEKDKIESTSVEENRVDSAVVSGATGADRSDEVAEKPPDGSQDDDSPRVEVAAKDTPTGTAKEEQPEQIDEAETDEAEDSETVTDVCVPVDAQGETSQPVEESVEEIDKACELNLGSTEATAAVQTEKLLADGVPESEMTVVRKDAIDETEIDASSAGDAEAGEPVSESIDASLVKSKAVGAEEDEGVAGSEVSRAQEANGVESKQKSKSKTANTELASKYIEAKEDLESIQERRRKRRFGIPELDSPTKPRGREGELTDERTTNGHRPAITNGLLTSIHREKAMADVSHPTLVDHDTPVDPSDHTSGNQKAHAEPLPFEGTGASDNVAGSAEREQREEQHVNNSPLSQLGATDDGIDISICDPVDDLKMDVLIEPLTGEAATASDAAEVLALTATDSFDLSYVHIPEPEDEEDEVEYDTGLSEAAGHTKSVHFAVPDDEESERDNGAHTPRDSVTAVESVFGKTNGDTVLVVSQEYGQPSVQPLVTEPQHAETKTSSLQPGDAEDSQETAEVPFVKTTGDVESTEDSITAVAAATTTTEPLPESEVHAKEPTKSPEKGLPSTEQPESKDTPTESSQDATVDVATPILPETKPLCTPKTKVAEDGMAMATKKVTPVVPKQQSQTAAEVLLPTRSSGRKRKTKVLDIVTPAPKKKKSEDRKTTSSRRASKPKTPASAKGKGSKKRKSPPPIKADDDKMEKKVQEKEQAPPAPPAPPRIVDGTQWDELDHQSIISDFIYTGNGSLAFGETAVTALKAVEAELLNGAPVETLDGIEEDRIYHKSLASRTRLMNAEKAARRRESANYEAAVKEIEKDRKRTKAPTKKTAEQIEYDAFLERPIVYESENDNNMGENLTVCPHGDSCKLCGISSFDPLPVAKTASEIAAPGHWPSKVTDSWRENTIGEEPEPTVTLKKGSNKRRSRRAHRNSNKTGLMLLELKHSLQFIDEYNQGYVDGYVDDE